VIGSVLYIKLGRDYLNAITGVQSQTAVTIRSIRHDRSIISSCQFILPSHTSSWTGFPGLNTS